MAFLLVTLPAGAAAFGPDAFDDETAGAPGDVVVVDVLHNDVSSLPVTITGLAFNAGSAEVDRQGTEDPGDDVVLYTLPDPPADCLYVFYEITDTDEQSDTAEIEVTEEEPTDSSDSTDSTDSSSAGAHFDSALGSQIEPRCGDTPSIVAPNNVNEAPTQGTAPATTASQLTWWRWPTCWSRCSRGLPRGTGGRSEPGSCSLGSGWRSLRCRVISV